LRKCRSICRAGGGQIRRAHEAPLLVEQRRDAEREQERERRKHEERDAPTGQIGHDARDQPAEKPAEARRRRVDAGDADDLARGPFLADVSNHHREDRRQRQALHETPEHQGMDAGRERHHDGRHDQRKHGRDDDAPAADDVGKGPDERRHQRDRQGRGGDRQARLAGAHGELAGQQRQHRLRRI
jgi:hypothetical protein